MAEQAAWTDQVQGMMNSWNEAQRKFYEGWMDAASKTSEQATAQMKNMESGSWQDWFTRWQESAQQSMDAWQTLAKKTLDTQLDWSQQDPFGGMVTGSSEQMKSMAATWTDQTTEMMQAWNSFQTKLWEGWFGVAKAAQEGAGTGSGKEWYDQWQKVAKESFDAWQDLTRKSTEIQAQWAKTAAEAGKKGTAAKATSKGA
ncbi:MAG TPA: hypothetical protein VFE20_08660 [Thermoleophilia bacterium]|nr:hypothetical protein [Thermoleophilia bacterium]